MIGPLVSGAVVGAGVAVCAVPGLAGDCRRLCTERIRRCVADARRLTGRRFAGDLAITERTEADLVVHQLAWGVSAAAASAMTALLVIPNVVAVATAMALGGVAGHAFAVARVRTAARERRRRFRHAFSAYLDLVNVLLAGGAGMETALSVAADAGDGWSFELIRTSLLRARVARRSPWDELARLGRRLDVPDLVEVAGTISLSGEHGARVRGSLAARAEALRHRQLADIEVRAQSATERMGVPLVLLFISFIGLLGYPALNMVVVAM